MMGMPALRVRVRQPAEEVGDLRIVSASGPDDEVPVIGHHDISQDAQRYALLRFEQHFLKSLEIRLLAKQAQPAIGPIEHMIGVASDDRSCTAWHGRNLPNPTHPVKSMIPVPLNYSIGHLDQRPQGRAAQM